MKKKIFNMFLLVSFCLTAVVVSADTENWRRFDSVNDLVGRWEGNLTVDIPEKLNEMVPKTSMDVRTIFEYSKNTMLQNTDFSLYMRIDFEKFLDDFLKFPEFKMLGLSKDVIWDVFAQNLSSMDELPDYNIVIKKYYFEINYDGRIDELVNDSSRGQIFLNSEKNQMKWLVNSAVALNLGNEDFMDLILYKTEK
jgi:hypothetical protein